jgi:hypothetical protein
VLELEQQGEQTCSHHFDHHRDDDAADRDPVGRVSGDRGQRHRFVAV